MQILNLSAELEWRLRQWLPHDLVAEKVGWANARPTNYEVTGHFYEGTGGWSNVLGHGSVPGGGGSQTLQNANAAARTFYSVKVTVTP